MPALSKHLGGNFFAAVMLVGLLFSVFTQHAWEDYWITFRASKNLATGHGLVFTPGERLHTFTSPLGVLLPAGLSWLTGNKSDELVLWLFRLMSLAALAGGVVLLLRVAQKILRHGISVFLTMALIALDSKTIDFSINGMETGLLIFFLALAIHGLVISGPRKIIRIGLGFAGLMWTRPDSCVYIAAMGVGALIFLREEKNEVATDVRRRTETAKTPPPHVGGYGNGLWKKLLLAGAICAVLYLPWFLWAWNYYGSPVPQPIVAKATNAEALSLVRVVLDSLLLPFVVLSASSMAFIFQPANTWFGGWHESVQSIATMLALVAIFAWMLPLLRPQTRLFSFVFFLGHCYLTNVLKTSYAWYLPPVAIFGFLTLGLLFDQILDLAKRLPELGWARGWFRCLPKVLRIVAIALVSCQLVVTVCVVRQLRVQQELIETGLRRNIGIWLRDHAQTPRDTVMLEPLGYIGYFSGLKMLDYPGLASKEMVEARKRLGKEKENLAYLELKPDWLVLRPSEITDGSIVEPGFRKYYDPVQIFDATEKIAAIRWLPGRGYLNYDRAFVIFHRKPETGVQPAVHN